MRQQSNCSEGEALTAQLGSALANIHGPLSPVDRRSQTPAQGPGKQSTSPEHHWRLQDEGEHGSDPRGVSDCATSVPACTYERHTLLHTDTLLNSCVDVPLRAMSGQNHPTAGATEHTHLRNRKSRETPKACSPLISRWGQSPAPRRFIQFST